MRIKLSFFSLALGIATIPSLALGQNPQYVNCHTLEAGGNFVTSNETIVNGMACQIAQPAAQSVASNQPVPSQLPAHKESPAVSASLTNSRIIEMAKIGLDDEIIIAKIKNGTCLFELGDSDLLDLKKAGVSSKVVAAMLDANALTSPRVTVNNNEVTLHTLGAAKVGGRIGHLVTVGIKSVKEKSYLEGQHSSVTTNSTPTIEIDLPKSVPIDNFILVQLDGKNDRREIEVDSVGGIVGSKHGIREEAIRKTHVTDLGGNKFQLGTETLKKGEYIIYVVGSADFEKGIYGRGYDFTVN